MGLNRLVDDLKKIEQFSLEKSLRQSDLLRQLIKQLKQDCEIMHTQIQKAKENLIDRYNES